jgi:hypothetical protein
MCEIFRFSPVFNSKWDGRAEGPFVAPALTASGELNFVAQQLPGISPVGLVVLAGGLLTLGVRHGRRAL